MITQSLMVVRPSQWKELVSIYRVSTEKQNIEQSSKIEFIAKNRLSSVQIQKSDKSSLHFSSSSHKLIEMTKSHEELNRTYKRGVFEQKVHHHKKPLQTLHIKTYRKSRGSKSMYGNWSKMRREKWSKSKAAF